MMYWILGAGMDSCTVLQCWATDTASRFVAYNAGRILSCIGRGSLRVITLLQHKKGSSGSVSNLCMAVNLRTAYCSLVIQLLLKFHMGKRKPLPAAILYTERFFLFHRSWNTSRGTTTTQNGSLGDNPLEFLPLNLAPSTVVDHTTSPHVHPPACTSTECFPEVLSHPYDRRIIYYHYLYVNSGGMGKPSFTAYMSFARIRIEIPSVPHRQYVLSEATAAYNTGVTRTTSEQGASPCTSVQYHQRSRGKTTEVGVYCWSEFWLNIVRKICQGVN